MKKIGKGNLVLLALVLVMSLAFIWSKNYKEKPHNLMTILYSPVDVAF